MNTLLCPHLAAIGVILCGIHFENGRRDTMHKQIFAVNILVSYKHVYQYTTQIIVDSLRRN